MNVNNKNNPQESYRGNRNLRKAGVEQEWTKEQIREYIKCSEDPVYFIKNYVNIVSVDEGVIPFVPWKFQVKLINNVHNNRFNVAKFSRQSGKCLDFSESINIRNKKTNEIISITIGEFYELQKKQKNGED